MADLYADVRLKAKLHSSLPSISPSARKAIYKNRPEFASTREFLTPEDALPEVDVVGQPSIKLKILDPGPGIVISIERYSRYAGFVTDEDLAGMKRLGKSGLEKLKALSSGTLSTQQQRLLNHPFGFGFKTPSGKRRRGLGRTTRIRGASNLAVVNKQSGDLYDAWDMDFIRTANGVKILYYNRTKQATYTAFGTSRMRAHGPYTTAPALIIPEIDREWRNQTLRAYHREKALMGLK